MSYNNKQLWFNGEIDSSEEKEITFFFSSSRIRKGSRKDLKRSFFRILQWIVQYHVIVWMATLSQEKNNSISRRLFFFQFRDETHGPMSLCSRSSLIPLKRRFHGDDQDKSFLDLNSFFLKVENYFLFSLYTLLAAEAMLTMRHICKKSRLPTMKFIILGAFSWQNRLLKSD